MNKNIRSFANIFPGVLLVLVLLLFSQEISQKAAKNIHLLELVNNWLSIQYEGIPYQSLQDGIPDEWRPLNWGSAKGTYAWETGFKGVGQAASLCLANNRGVFSLTQDFAVEPNDQLVFSVFARGGSGALQFRFHSKGSENWISKGWREIKPSDDWEKYRLTVKVPGEVDGARLLLRTNSSLAFDNAVLFIEKNGVTSENVLKNPGFEVDGISEDPLTWWDEQVKIPGRAPQTGQEARLPVSFLNVSDMLAQQYRSIQERAEDLGQNCKEAPGMTSWLLGLKNELEESGGVAAEERLYKLAIFLAPECPQTYGALASLYEQNYSFSKAAELYHQAAILATGSDLAGRYYFAEGLLHFRQTGDYKSAIHAFELAENIQGWERGAWYRGAASFYLGQAFEALDLNSKAIDAYRHVLQCTSCTYYYNSAKERLAGLTGSGTQ